MPVLQLSLRLLRSLEATTLLKSSLPVACGHLARNLVSRWRGRRPPPLSKVVVPMPQVTHVIVVQELGVTFEAWIVNAASLLMGNYNITKHNAYKGLRHGRLNQVFELAGVLCQPRPCDIPLLTRTVSLTRIITGPHYRSN
jgi:hypothetical protein